MQDYCDNFFVFCGRRTMMRIISVSRPLLLVGCSVLALLALHSWQRRVRASEPDTLRVHSLEIVDSAGVARLRMGAPLPGPQMSGTTSPRRSAANGIQINDAHGDEMGGFSMLDDGTLSLCFDSRKAEATCMYVMPSGERGFSVTDNAGKDRIRMILSPDESTAVSLNDNKEKTRIELRLDKQGNSSATVLDQAGKTIWKAPR
jgi:hypothetical protein